MSVDVLGRTGTRLGLAPGALVAVFMLAHTVLWTLTPALTHAGLPLDVVEGYAIGHEWVVGFYKHPALPAWLLEASRLLTGRTGWPAYLVSALCVAATYAAVYALGRDMMDRHRAAAGTLLLTGVLYFSWVVPEFNHNVVQMPLWMGVILALWRARRSASARAWMLLGAVSALSLYAKLAGGLLLAVAGAYVLTDARMRRQLATPAPWLGLAVFCVGVAPLLHWLVQTDFLALAYAAERAQGGRAGTVVMFLLKQIASAGGLLLLAAAAFGWPRRWSSAIARPASGTASNVSTSSAPPAATVPRPIDAGALRFLIWFLAVPLAATALLALVTGSGLKGSWGTPMLSLAGLLAVALAGPAFAPASLDRIAAGAALLLLAIPATYATLVMKPSGKLLTPKRTSWPQHEIAREMERIWRGATGRPLRVVMGDAWIAGMIAVAGRDRPSLLIEGSARWSPWIERRRLEADGMLVVWWRAAKDPPEELRPWIGTRIDGSVRFAMRNGDRHEMAEIVYTVVRPGQVRWADEAEPRGAERP